MTSLAGKQFFFPFHPSSTSHSYLFAYPYYEESNESIEIVYQDNL